MKKFFSVKAAVLCLVLASCESSQNRAIESDLTRLDNYFDSVGNETSDYSRERWNEVKAEYDATIAKAEAEKNELSEETNRKLEEVKADFKALETRYETGIREKEEADYRRKLRTSLFGDPSLGNDKSFAWVTAQNAYSVYERFVNTVKDNKDNYSREDWDEIKVLYEALDTRKNEIENDLPKGDNGKIARKKIEFAAVKAVNRPFSKIEENEEAKN